MAAVVPSSGAPVSESIERQFGSKKTLRVMQTRKGCFQEMMGCEDTSEFNIATQEDQETLVMYAIEESSCFQRIMCPANRAMSMKISESKGGPQFLMGDMDLHCGLGACCLAPKMTMKDESGSVLGWSTSGFQCTCVQKIDVHNSTGELVYRVSPPHCCGGCCIQCYDSKHGNGCMCFKVPFYIYPAGDLENDVGNITKQWRGFGTEVFSDADTFTVEFPENVDANMKANLLGTTFFLNSAFFERQKNQSS